MEDLDKQLREILTKPSVKDGYHDEAIAQIKEACGKHFYDRFEKIVKDEMSAYGQSTRAHVLERARKAANL